MDVIPLCPEVISCQTRATQCQMIAPDYVTASDHVPLRDEGEDAEISPAIRQASLKGLLRFRVDSLQSNIVL